MPIKTLRSLIIKAVQNTNDADLLDLVLKMLTIESQEHLTKA